MGEHRVKYVFNHPKQMLFAKKCSLYQTKQTKLYQTKQKNYIEQNKQNYSKQNILQNFNNFLC